MNRIGLPRDLLSPECTHPSNVELNTWLTIFERYLNCENRLVRSWLTISESCISEMELLLALYRDSRPDREQVPDSVLTTRTLESAAEVLKCQPYPSDDDMRTIEYLKQKAQDSRDSDKWIIDHPFFETINAILIEPRYFRAADRDYTGLPTYNDCILIIDAALAATDDGEASPRHTDLTGESLKKFFQRNREKLGLQKEWF